MRRPLVVPLVLCALVGCARAGGDRVVRPRAVAASEPVQVNQVQSAAVWVHPTDPDRSLLFITNEQKGLEVHDPAGPLLKHVAQDAQTAYVDVVYGFPLNGGAVDLVLASCRATGSAGVKVWRIDPAKRKLTEVTSGAAVPVFDGRVPPVGLCAYHSPRTGRAYFFVTEREGRVEQYELSATADGRVTAARVRAFALEGEVKSCIADEEFGAVYVAEDDLGVWRYPAEPDDPAEPALIIRAGEHGLVPNVKGPALYGAADGKGYLLVLTQGPRLGRSTVKVYDRGGANAYVATIDPSPAGRGGAVEHCSGLAVCNEPLGPRFPGGLLAINDQINPNASEDFKLFSWADVARGGGLIADTGWSRRAVTSTGGR